ncbi:MULTISPECIES: hypothetical protein [unclassified Bradyrhizobium]|uniref:hypothetical protein n=1 Tax=unclassified Bradyrhizobium TaxID=2631580 RepID=UPI002915C65C|nr:MULTISPECIES: hypothetical protein [unclassified Bradyrhizobium]
MVRFPNVQTLVLWIVLLGTGSAHAQTVSPDDTARVLAGMQPSAGSPLAALTQDPSWQRHAKFFDNAFGQLEQRQLSKIRAWADTNLAAPRPTMFYFFSGPDFLYADAFHSKATTYVMAALEPTGPVPDLTRLPRGGIGSALAYVEHSLQSILSFSFFITKQMKTDLHEGDVNGTLPILYVFLARSGKTIHTVELVWLDDTGAVHGSNEQSNPNATRGARISFAGSDGVEKTLYYFSTDLSNSGVKSSGFLKFCEPLAPGNSLLKSASYLLHSGNFSVVRSWLLKNSATIVQDDSGVPLASFDSRAWRFFPFGRYAGPIEKFPSMYQERYADLFDRAQPLDFGIGYRWRTRESNVLLAVRLPAAEATSSAEAMLPAEPVTQAARPRRGPRPPEPIPAYPRRQRSGFWFWPGW